MGFVSVLFRVVLCVLCLTRCVGSVVIVVDVSSKRSLAVFAVAQGSVAALGLVSWSLSLPLASKGSEGVSVRLTLTRRNNTRCFYDSKALGFLHQKLVACVRLGRQAAGAVAKCGQHTEQCEVKQVQGLS